MNEVIAVNSLSDERVNVETGVLEHVRSIHRSLASTYHSLSVPPFLPSLHNS